MSTNQASDSIIKWQGFGPGWYGLLRDAFSSADRFGKFTEDEYDVLAQVATECIESTQRERCDQRYHPGPGQAVAQCLLSRGHFGEHEAIA